MNLRVTLGVLAIFMAINVGLYFLAGTGFPFSLYAPRDAAGHDPDLMLFLNVSVALITAVALGLLTRCGKAPRDTEDET